MRFWVLGCGWSSTGVHFGHWWRDLRLTFEMLVAFRAGYLAVSTSMEWCECWPRIPFVPVVTCGVFAGLHVD